MTQKNTISSRLNPYVSGERKNIPATLIYARDGESRVLMIYKDFAAVSSGGRDRDGHAGKYNGLGGKLNADESYRAGAAREFAEEAGLKLPESRFRWVGALLFPNFKPRKSEDWSVQLFEAYLTPDEAARVKASREGRLEWIEASRVLELPLWDGDREFLPHVLEGKPVVGTLWYEEGRCVRTELHSI